MAHRAGPASLRAPRARRDDSAMQHTPWTRGGSGCLGVEYMPSPNIAPQTWEGCMNVIHLLLLQICYMPHTKAKSSVYFEDGTKFRLAKLRSPAIHALRSLPSMVDFPIQCYISSPILHRTTGHFLHLCDRFRPKSDREASAPRACARLRPRSSHYLQWCRTLLGKMALLHR